VRVTVTARTPGIGADVPGELGAVGVLAAPPQWEEAMAIVTSVAAYACFTKPPPSLRQDEYQPGGFRLSFVNCWAVRAIQIPEDPRPARRETSGKEFPSERVAAEARSTTLHTFRQTSHLHSASIGVITRVFT
jgi:hypothetical protein